jgi:hypothetical protein
MLSQSSFPAGRPQPAPLSCVHNGGPLAFLANAREDSRGCRRTPSNGLKEL